MRELYRIETKFVYANAVYEAGASVWLGPHAAAAMRRVYGDAALSGPIASVGATPDEETPRPGADVAISLQLLARAEAALIEDNGTEIRSVLAEVYDLQEGERTTWREKAKNKSALEAWVAEAHALLAED